MRTENNVAELKPGPLQEDDRPGAPSPYSCPDCGGVLWEIEEGELVRFRCRVGHAYSPENMLTAQDDVLEEALWMAVKTLEENARLSHRLAEAEREKGHDWMAKRFSDRELDARARVEVIRRVLRDRSEEVVVAHTPNG
jgi:two-component system chemotaxis response regulator CheB